MPKKGNYGEHCVRTFVAHDRNPIQTDLRGETQMRNFGSHDWQVQGKDFGCFLLNLVVRLGGGKMVPDGSWLKASRLILRSPVSPGSAWLEPEPWDWVSWAWPGLHGHAWIGDWCQRMQCSHWLSLGHVLTLEFGMNWSWKEGTMIVDQAKPRYSGIPE